MPPQKDLIVVNSEKLNPEIDLTKAPIENDKQVREQILLDNTPAKFEIRDNPNLNSNSAREKTINSLVKDDDLARKTVKKYDASIEKFSKKHGVKADLVRAIMWAENARGDKFGLNRVADLVGVSGSQRPLNINGEKWGALINKPGERLNDGDENIEAGVILIKRIQDRSEKPTATKIGSIWNYAGRENANDFGAAIGEIYKERPWEKKK